MLVHDEVTIEDNSTTRATAPVSEARTSDGAYFRILINNIFIMLVLSLDVDVAARASLETQLCLVRRKSGQGHTISLDLESRGSEI